jgi:hypothetical protein
MTNDAPQAYIPPRMLRRALTILLVLSLAAFGTQPAAAAGMAAVPAVADEMSAASESSAMPDCARMVEPDDCCDRTGGQKQDCAWDAACAARCHVNLGIAPAIHMPLVGYAPTRLVVVGEPQSPVLARPGPLFRPPIL